jgi:hypothetical protein
MMGSFRSLLIIAALGLAATGCSSVGKALGGGKNPPDEFAIVTKAPLTLPPDYALRPPRPGETRPQEKSTSERAQELLVGDASKTPPSQGELLLVQQVGALNIDPNIRQLLGAENGGHIAKDASLANRVLFWRIAGNAVDDSAAPLRVENPEEWLANREASIAKVTAGQEVTINKSSKILNLPGVR